MVASVFPVEHLTLLQSKMRFIEIKACPSTTAFLHFLTEGGLDEDTLNWLRQSLKSLDQSRSKDQATGFYRDQICSNYTSYLLEDIQLILGQGEGRDVAITNSGPMQFLDVRVGFEDLINGRLCGF